MADTVEGLVKRDIYEVANQLQGYVGPGTPDDLAAFLVREGTEAGHLADEIVRLRTQVEALVVERDALRAKLFPYADDTSISGMSWGGFYLIGNDKSIKELRRIEHRAAQLEVYRAAFDERSAALEARALAAEAQRDKLREALKPLADEAEAWGPENGEERTWGDSVELWQSPSRRTKITVGDARRARSTLDEIAP